ncbi:MAG: UbiD family decarboxylase [Polyangia bacterium]
MPYVSLRDCVDDLERTGQLRRVDVEIDAHLEAAEIQRRVFRARGPALYFARVKDCRFPMVSNLFGTMERARFIFRDSLDKLRRLVELRADPGAACKHLLRYAGVPFTLLRTRPRRVAGGPVFADQVEVSELPQLQCWPDDGGAFITLPQVYSEDPERPGPAHSNLGMYRIQLSGGQYQPNREVGLHYQIHRGIGVHHAAAIRRGEILRVNVYVGGPPAMTLAAVMPLPEGVSELAFAGALGGRRVRLAHQKGWTLPVYADADFCLLAEVDPDVRKPEGPFGDHLGYYSLAHDFPVLRVRRIYHRQDAIWPFTVVGRPPQEDSVFGALIHEITGPLISSILPGVHAVNAVDAAGVHPLLLALGSERYVPFEERQAPQELLTQANAILGQGQLSLAKYLFMAAVDDDPQLDGHNVSAFLQHVLARVDWRRDLHFQTQTTIDTLDYSGTGLNRGSKLVVAAVGRPRRTLPTEPPPGLRLPDGFADARVCLPGVLAVRAPASCSQGLAEDFAAFCAAFQGVDPICAFPLVVLVDDSEFCSRSLDNFLWVTFSRSNPATDVGGIEAATVDKHWGCRGSLVIDARRRPHHAPLLIEDPQVTARVDVLFAKGGPLAGLE